MFLFQVDLYNHLTDFVSSSISRRWRNYSNMKRCFSMPLQTFISCNISFLFEIFYNIIGFVLILILSRNDWHKPTTSIVWSKYKEIEPSFYHPLFLIKELLKNYGSLLCGKKYFKWIKILTGSLPTPNAINAPTQTHKLIL